MSQKINNFTSSICATNRENMESLQLNIYKSLFEHKENTAFVCEGNSYSYLQFIERITDIQNAYFNLPKVPTSIGIVANQDFDTYSAIIAALLSGITYIPIETTHPDERNNHIIRSANIEIIFSSDSTDFSSDFLKKNSHKIIEISLVKRYNRELRIISGNNPAYILFTSGSTGIPKGVPISHENLKTFSKNVKRMNLAISQQSKFLQVFDLTFDLSVFSFLIPLLHGASVYTLAKTPLRHTSAVQLIEEKEITHILTVPSFVSFLKPYFRKIKLPSVQQWLFCGEALKTDLVSAWQQCVPSATIYNVYGPTEATIFCTSYNCQDNNIKEYHGMVSIGKPFSDTEFILLNNSQTETGFNTTAELLIGGSQLTSGYLNDAERNKSAFVTLNSKVYYRSGDVCQCDENGDYFFIGRNDSQVKINGFRVEISELEYHSRLIPGILECVVLASENKKNNQLQLNLLYSSENQLTYEVITGFLSQRVPPYMLPSRILFVSNIPYNVNGKIDKIKLTELLEQS
jgi:D-alanine--poly(phosphoribitol) ligase subunit 1